MKGFVLAVSALLVGLLMAPSAEAHHATASKVTVGVYWKCTENYAISKGKTRRTRGTTKRHTHITPPSAQHKRRHRCVKRTKAAKPAAPASPAPAPAPTVIYVTQPCGCTPPQPPEPCGDNCGGGGDDQGDDDDNGHGHGRHHGKKGHGHGKDCD